MLRPGGTVVVSLVFGFEYDRSVAFEARYTEQQLRALFGAWHDVRVREDGGRTVTWAVLTGSLLHGLEQRVRGLAPRLAAPVFAATYAGLNGIALALERAERTDGAAALPMNLTLVAQKPRDLTSPSSSRREAAGDCSQAPRSRRRWSSVRSITR